MGIFESLGNGIKNHFDKKKEQRERMDALRQEANMMETLEFEKAFKTNALEVARANAKRDAAKLSGLQKLRAMNRARNLSSNTIDRSPGSFLSKLSEFTQKTRARREENLKHTAELRAAAKEMNKERLAKRQLPQQRMGGGRTIGGNRTW